jgi:hypothetical protein
VSVGAALVLRINAMAARTVDHTASVPAPASHTVPERRSVPADG